MKQRLVLAIVVAAVAWHAWAVIAQGWAVAVDEKHGRDYASYHYAVQVAAEGGDPYEKRALAKAARVDRTRLSVHPFFYPPPFLLFVVWTLPFELVTAYRIWFWLDELALWAAALALWRWWRPLGDELPAVIAVAVAALTAVVDNHLMGQANLPVLALVIAGLWQVRERPALGGALVGVACMLKMSPALIVLWWLVQRRWLAAGAAVGAGVVLTLLSLPLVPLDVQWRFYTEILPGFGSGDYNGLSVPIGLFGNHSLPNLWHQAFPGKQVLSPTARVLSMLTALALVGGLLVAFRRPTGRWGTAGQASAILVVMLLVPVYTYEHHVVWAIPAVVLAGMALVKGRLPWWVAVPVALAFVAWAWDLSELKALWQRHRKEPALAFAIQEVKLVALLVWAAVAGAIGGSSIGDDGGTE